ncbi:YbaB/EbfC family nucleoid-associated protein [Antrihabitans sp. YC3-6]|uniref:YbaB/EbfC family nucleoid-associated protein n=2 Tax=Antrihabitans stalagmiti TaxID=2799499 RepID=A0A934NNR1_9NOCA|nr:YbaB/EbfC family nucleoid-associated protein [Antrihabitans stalagmiti]
MHDVTAAQQKRARLTARASAEDKRVMVTVNAEGVVIETEFASDVDDLSYDEIAAAVTRAAQEAAREVARLSQELLEPLAAQRARLPSLSEVVPGMPDLRDLAPKPPVVSTAPPGSRDREAAVDDSAMEFTDVEEIDHTGRAGKGPGITDSSW